MNTDTDDLARRLWPDVARVLSAIGGPLSSTGVNVLGLPDAALGRALDLCEGVLEAPEFIMIDDRSCDPRLPWSAETRASVLAASPDAAVLAYLTGRISRRPVSFTFTRPEDAGFDVEMTFDTSTFFPDFTDERVCAHNLGFLFALAGQLRALGPSAACVIVDGDAPFVREEMEQGRAVVW